MHRMTLLALPSAAIPLLLTLGSACSGGSEEAPAESARETPATESRPAPEAEPVHAAIEQEWKRLRNVEGREGILAEKRRYSLFDEELIIRDFFQDRRGGYFVDVGCAWPVDANNTYYLEKHLGWKGIGIDALAEFAPGWKNKRPNSRFFNYLVTDHSGVKEQFFRSPQPGLSSTNRNLASGRWFGAELEPEEIRVEAITLDDLLEREGVTKIDLLAMDIEGHEAKALAGFDIDRFRPELVVVEGPMLSTQGATDPVKEYLEKHGYELIEKYRPFDATNRYYKPKR